MTEVKGYVWAVERNWWDMDGCHDVDVHLFYDRDTAECFFNECVEDEKVDEYGIFERFADFDGFEEKAVSNARGWVWTVETDYCQVAEFVLYEQGVY